MSDSSVRYLVTGGAGFIGYHVCEALLRRGHLVTSIDSVSDYYDPGLKRARLARLAPYPRFSNVELSIEDEAGLAAAFERARPDVVIHLAAQAGVRYSLDHPRSYINANILGTFNVMEQVRLHQPRHFLMASTSSVYGANTKTPFSETDAADHPITLYSATKKAAEVMTHSYAHLWNLPTTMMRFFTVYGPWGRPDMALFKMTRKLFAGEEIDVYGEGEMYRDFTYIDDLVEAILRLIAEPPHKARAVGGDGVDTVSPVAPHRVINVGGGHPVRLMDFVRAIERHVGRPARLRLLPMQTGEMHTTYASADLIEALTHYRPATSIDEGVGRFVAWYRAYYGMG